MASGILIVFVCSNSSSGSSKGVQVHANFNCAIIPIHQDRTRPDERVSSIYLNSSIVGSTICQHTF